MCVSDGTGSMGCLWETAKLIINQTFDRIGIIAGAAMSRIEFKWVIYKDYDAGSDVVQASPWTQNPKDILSWLNKHSMSGGGDWEEAVEKGLQAANAEENPPTRIILIGDAPPHWEKKGQKIAQQGNHVLDTDFMEEAKALAEKKIPIYAFYMDPHEKTRATFGEMATLTGGQVSELRDAKDLMDIIAVSCLADVGGDELIHKYVTNFGTKYKPAHSG